MNKKIVTLVILLLNSILFSQYYKFVVYFKDKSPIGYPYSVSNPSAFLSERAIDRRAKSGITILTNDLPVAPIYIDSVLNVSDSISLFCKSKWMNLIMIGMSDSSLISAIQSLHCVDRVEYVYKGPRPRLLANIPATFGPEYIPTSTYELNYGMSLHQTEMIGIDYIHRHGYTGQGIVIAVMDVGFSNYQSVTGFQHLRDSLRIKGTWDFVNNEENVERDGSHGTNVLSTMAGYLPNLYLGTAPSASYYLLETEDGQAETLSEEYSWLAGAEYADSVGADLINSSLGYTTFDIPIWDHTYADMDGNTTICSKAADLAASKGILVCNSAGNSGNSSWRYLGAPSDADSILGVGAVDSSRIKAIFSSWGPSADQEIKPNVSTMGQDAALLSTGGNPITGNGTSFSSPILCGAIASLWSKHPTKNFWEIKSAVEKSASIYHLPDSAIGYGIPNFGVADQILNNINLSDLYTGQVLQVYPNPASENNINFDYYSNISEDVKIEITNMKGKVVFSTMKKVFDKTMNHISIQLDRIARGTYILNVSSIQKNFTSKFLIQ